MPASRMPATAVGMPFWQQRVPLRRYEKKGWVRIWWARQDSNLRQHRYERRVLTTELQARTTPFDCFPSLHKATLRRKWKATPDKSS